MPAARRLAGLLLLLALASTAARLSAWAHSFEGGLLSCRPASKLTVSKTASPGVNLLPSTARVLLLGGSVLSPSFGSAQARLAAQLESRWATPVLIENACTANATTYDSMERYRRLERRHFDWIIVYHGIEDVPMNRWPARAFRADYSHAFPCWSRWARAATDHAPQFARRGLSQLLAPLSPLPGDDCHAGQIKTAVPFHDHLARIIDLANARGAKVIMATFAYHLPADYSPAAFARHQLDYGRHLVPVEYWGEPQSVARGLVRHNQVIRQLAEEFPAVRLVDARALLPAGRRTFDDLCHLSEEGSARLAEHLADAMEAAPDPSP